MKKVIGSLGERMKTMNRIKVDGTEQFVVEITHNGETIAEYLMSFQEVEYSLSTRKTRVVFSVTDPFTLSTTQYHPV